MHKINNIKFRNQNSMNLTNININKDLKNKIKKKDWRRILCKKIVFNKISYQSKAVNINKKIKLAKQRIKKIQTIQKMIILLVWIIRMTLMDCITHLESQIQMFNLMMFNIKIQILNRKKKKKSMLKSILINNLILLKRI